MKYVSPMYEKALLEASDILMSGEIKYTIEETKDESGNSVGNVIMGAFDLFK
ncbi:MAG: hypothetical protein J6A90_00595 [Clostridia bacterium]|nr:hypothetical protein [Clostridia bacterium]